MDDGEAHADLSPSEVPEFDSGDVMAKLESTRLIPGRGHHDDDSHAASYPYTPKNSFVDNHFDVSYQKYVFNQRDTEAITEKLRQEHFFPEESDEWRWDFFTLRETFFLIIRLYLVASHNNRRWHLYPLLPSRSSRLVLFLDDHVIIRMYSLCKSIEQKYKYKTLLTPQSLIVFDQTQYVCGNE